jgi:predicted ATP-binding protein involved in virulence
MELIYCYIKEYKSLKNCELNFGGKYRFKFSAEQNRLQLNEDVDYIKNYFPSMIDNVSAIVGENGSGKSSIIEFLLENLTEGIATGNPEAIIIKWDYQTARFHIYISTQLFKNLNHNLPIDQDFSHELRYSITESLIIYYTNSFYDRIDLSGISGLLNISFKNQFLSQGPDGNKINEVGPQLIEGFQNFMFAEYWRILRFMQSGIKIDIDFRLPKYLILSNSPSYFMDIPATQKLFNLLQSKYPSDKALVSSSEKFAEVTNMIAKNRIKKDAPPKVIFKTNLETVIIYDNFFHHPEIMMDYLKDKISLDTSGIDALIRSILGGGEYYQKVLNFLTATDEILDSYAENYDSENIWINTDSIPEATLLNYIRLLKDIMHHNSRFLIIQFGFNSKTVDSLSSGELAILSLLSRFYALSRGEQIFSNLHVNKHAIILIDEGELYLHPSWQKKLINILASNLPLILTDARLQIILTSHSPFVLSDLPKSKVSFIVKPSSRTTGSQILEHNQTLAANIHTLFADAFFMEDGFTGNYAKRIIDQVIRDLNTTKEIDGERREDIRRIIIAIGEPILKKKLNEMYHEKFNLDLDDRITRLERNIGI